MNVVRNDSFCNRGGKMGYKPGMMRAQTVGFIPHSQLLNTVIHSQSAQRNALHTPHHDTTSSSSAQIISTSSSSSGLAMLNTSRMQATKQDVTPVAGPSSYSDVPKTTSSSEAALNKGCRQLFKIPTPVSSRCPSRSPSSIKTPSKRIHTSSVRTPMKTPTSTTSNNSENDSRCIVAISEGRGQARGEVGIAALDIRRPYLILCQISDRQTYNNTLIKINVLNPVQVLVPHTFCDGQQLSKLFNALQDAYPSITFTTLQRRHFSDGQGLHQIQRLCALEYSSVEILVKHKFYALAAVSALIKFCEHIQNMIFVPKSLKVEYQGSQNSTIIDVETAHHLELVRSLRGSVTHHSLLGLLNHCHTAGGTRLLRANILQPYSLPTTINTRLECVRELVENQSLFHSLQTILPKFADVDRLLILCMHQPQQDNMRTSETQLNYVILLKTSLELLPTLSAALEEVEAEFLCSFREVLEDVRYKNILAQILETIHENSHTSKGYLSTQMQRCFAVKPHLDGLLDVARKTYCEIVEDITTMVKELEEKHNLPLKIGYTAIKGFHIQLSISGKNNIKESDLPRDFIQIQKSRSTLTFTTQLLVHADERCRDVLNEIQKLSNTIIFKLLGDIREHIGSLYKLCENISELDMLLSFAKVSAASDYVCPEFGEVMDVKDSRHPMLDYISQMKCVENDIFSSVNQNFHIITGPNMGGKSIYIRQIVLLQIMAQIGCYVPAKSATFRIADHIFSRMSFDDNIECNASTFVLEVKEVQYILQTLTPHSLIIMDELGRGTSSEEGTAVAWALCEQLLQTDAFIFLTTHFILLTKLEVLYSNVTNHFVEAVEREDNDNPLHYTHRLRPGVTGLESYGLYIAQRLGMPDSIVGRAKELAQDISAQKKPTPVIEGSLKDCRTQWNITSVLLKHFEEGSLTKEKCSELKEQLCCPEPENTSAIVSDPQASDMEVFDCSPVHSYIQPPAEMNSTEITVRTILEMVCGTDQHEE